jgi:hypothetical protein
LEGGAAGAILASDPHAEQPMATRSSRSPKPAARKTARKPAKKAPAAKKVAANRPGARKVATKRPAAKKAASRKVATKKTATKKSASKRTAAKKTATKQIAPRTAAKKKVAKAPARKAAPKRAASPARRPPQAGAKPALLSGGNPQISKGYGDAPVQAYIAAMPGWKREVGRRLDALIERHVPGVRKAVKWNSPLFGAPGDDGWFVGWHCYTDYIKITFFRGALLDPPPPELSKMKDVRYWHIHGHQPLDEKRFSHWIEQARRLPGEKL